MIDERPIRRRGFIRPSNSHSATPKVRPWLSRLNRDTCRLIGQSIEVARYPPPHADSVSGRVRTAPGTVERVGSIELGTLTPADATGREHRG